MRQWRARPIQTLLFPEHAIRLTEVTVLFETVLHVVRRVDAKEILRAGQDEQRARRERPQQIPAIESGRPCANEILLRIVHRSGRVKVRAGDVLRVARRHNCGGEAIIHGGQYRGQSAAARLSRGREPLRIHQRMG